MTGRFRHPSDASCTAMLKSPISEEGTMPAPDPEGQISLMLCESILHLLVEERLISKERALEAIDGVVELVREIEETGKSPTTNRSAATLIEAIAQSFVVKD